MPKPLCAHLFSLKRRVRVDRFTRQSLYTVRRVDNASIYAACFLYGCADSRTRNRRIRTCAMDSRGGNCGYGSSVRLFEWVCTRERLNPEMAHQYSTGGWMDCCVDTSCLIHKEYRHGADAAGCAVFIRYVARARKSPLGSRTAAVSHSTLSICGAKMAWIFYLNILGQVGGWPRAPVYQRGNEDYFGILFRIKCTLNVTSLLRLHTRVDGNYIENWVEQNRTIKYNEDHVGVVYKKKKVL